MRRKYKYKIGQKFFNKDYGDAMKVIWRWRGKEVDFYDVLLTRKNGFSNMWSFDELEMDKWQNPYNQKSTPVNKKTI